MRGRVEAATEAKFDEGMAGEREIFMAADAHARVKALRHPSWRARRQQDPRRARRHAGARSSQAVIGAGTMGGGISMNFLNAGIPVTILEMKQEALDRGVATIRKNYEAQVKKGKLKQDKYEQRMAC